jgi:hypothetical protein
MKLIIEARMEDEDAELPREPVRLAVIDRIDDDDLEQLGLSLDEGRALMTAAQSAVVSSQTMNWLLKNDYCRRCFTPLRRKDSRSIVVRTVFGKVGIPSPRFWTCACGQRSGASPCTFSPLSEALPKRVTPELEYLQVKWAAHLPYAAATTLLKEVLPLQNSISTTGTKNRVRTAGQELDARIEREIAALPRAEPVGDTCESTRVTAVSVDSAWLKHCAPPRFAGRQVNIVAGRATLLDGKTKLYAYVGKRVRCAATRLDHFLVKQGVRHNERVTVISDGAGEFTKAVDGSQLARGRILDWFHIAMKFRAAEQSIFSSGRIEGPDWDRIGSEIKSAKWLVWHGKGRKAVPRLQAINDELERWPDQEQSALWWNVRKACTYLRSHTRFLVNYGARHRKGLPISSSIAESAVNQVASLRMAKKRQMRWSDEGAHVLALVRVEDLNGDLSAHTFGAITRLRGSAVDRIRNEGMALAA